MKRVSVYLLFVVGLFATSSLLISAAETGNVARPKIYDESADGAKQVADALALAKKDGKHVLIQFGGNWCGWCIKLHRLFETNKVVNDVLRTNYVLVLIDYNDRNKSLVSKYKAQELGLPSLVVLGSDGKHLTTKNSAELEQGDHHDPQKVLAFLKEWSPGDVKRTSVSAAVQKFLEKPQQADDSLEFERIRERSAEALPLLVAAIQSRPTTSAALENKHIRAYWALGRLGAAAKSAVPFLAEQMNSNTPQNVRGFVSGALTKIGSDAKEAIPALLDALHSDDQRLRIDAAYTLAHLDPNNRELIPTMLECLTSTDVVLRRSATWVLEALGAAAKAAAPAVKQALLDSDETVRQRATNVLAKINAAAGSETKNR